jgi:hypothetical protein
MNGGPHVALLGDSIFDNRAYTDGEPDVAAHLRSLIAPSWHVTLCAVDGATTQSLAPQLRRVPSDASHVVLAVGGNDALRNTDLLDRPVRSTAETLALLHDRVEAFRQDYAAALEAVLRLQRITVVCTIYNGALEPPRAELARVALTTFNDVIISAAVERHLDVIELRSICTEPGDYANPIEPSGRGGRKIAMAIARAIEALPHDRPSRIIGS